MMLSIDMKGMNRELAMGDRKIRGMARIYYNSFRDRRYDATYGPLLEGHPSLRQSAIEYKKAPDPVESYKETVQNTKIFMKTVVPDLFTGFCLDPDIDTDVKAKALKLLGQVRGVFDQTLVFSSILRDFYLRIGFEFLESGESPKRIINNQPLVDEAYRRVIPERVKAELYEDISNFDIKDSDEFFYELFQLVGSNEYDKRKPTPEAKTALKKTIDDFMKSEFDRIYA